MEKLTIFLILDKGRGWHGQQRAGTAQVLAVRKAKDCNGNSFPQSKMNVKEDYVSELWEGVRKELGRMVNNLVQSKNQEGDHFSGTGLIEQPTVG